MKKLLFLTLILLMAGCKSDNPQGSSEPVIDFMCKDAAEDKLTQEEIEWWDSANADGGYMLVRGAERNLDTIVNHLHMIFITEP